MPEITTITKTKEISFKNILLNVNNRTELSVECKCYDGAKHIGDAIVTVDIKEKSATEIKNQAKEALKTKAQWLLENEKPTYDVPSNIADFSTSVEFEEK